MRCREARDVLWPPELPRLLEPRVQRARSHVRACTECTLYFAQDRRMLDACHGLRSLRAPAEVRLRVLDVMATAGRRERPATATASYRGGAALRVGRETSRERVRVVAALVVAVVGIGGTALGFALTGARVPEATSPSPEDAFVGDYLRRAVAQDFLESSDREEIVRFLQRELGLSSGPLHAPGLVPARVEICLLEGRRGAMIVYHFEDRTVTHYLVPDGSPPRAPRVADNRGELAVVTWSSGAVEEALVGEVPVADLLAMATAEALE